MRNPRLTSLRNPKTYMVHFWYKEIIMRNPKTYFFKGF